MHEDIRLGIIKAVVFANALKEHDASYEFIDEEERKPPIPVTLVRVARNGLVVQLMSLIDEAFEAHLHATYLGQKCRKFGDRVTFLLARGVFVFPHQVQKLPALRNKLAHEREAYATWDDWSLTWNVARRELVHLGIVSEVMSQREPDEDDEEDE